MDEYDHMNQDMWWRSETSRQNPHTNYSYDDGFYSNECYEDDQYESYDNGYYVSYDNDGWCNNSSVQNQYYESQPSSENQERSDLSDMWDEMLENAKKIKEQQEKTDQALLNMQKRLDSISKHLNQPPPENHSDTTEVSEVSFPCPNGFIDNQVHEPTPSEVEMVVEDCVSLDVQDSEVVCEIEEVVNDFENCNESLHDLEISKVGEGFVEVNTTPIPMDLKANEHEKEPLVVVKSKKLICFKQPHVVINLPLLSTIYIQNSWRDGMINVIFGNQKVRYLSFETTNVPPISGDTTRNLEKCLSCCRSKALECQSMKRKFSRKKHDATYSHKSKMKILHSIKSRSKNFTRRKILWFHKTRFKRYHGRHKARRFGFYKVKESMPFDPGGSRFTHDPP